MCLLIVHKTNVSQPHSVRSPAFHAHESLCALGQRLPDVATSQPVRVLGFTLLFRIVPKPDSNSIPKPKTPILKPDRQVAAARVRVEPLGADRRDRRYWWFRSEPRALFVEDPDSGAAAVVCDGGALEATLPRLNRKGLREVQL